jgi:CTP synthase (UTP-ammonia lyase)
VRVTLVIDLPPAARYHRATVDALHHAADATHTVLDLRVCASDAVDDAATDGYVVGPGSPYRDEIAVWSLVRDARAAGIPLVGT